MRPLVRPFAVIALLVSAVVWVPAFSALVDPVKQALENHKNAVCDVADIVAGLEGPLSSQKDKDWVADQVLFAATLSQRLLDDVNGPLYATPEMWLHWMPIDAGTMSLDQVAAAACESACDALYAYCELIETAGPNPGLAEEAAEALWQSQQLFCHIYDAAGIDE